MKVLDLFSGIGGFSLGLERAGMQTIAFCEIEPYCQAVLKKHWPNVQIFNDVTKLHGRDVEYADVICGGFPCQDISLAGKGKGIKGARSGLWTEFARLIGEIRPRYAIIENVPALRSRGLSRVLSDLCTVGYDAEWHCIPASAFGAPHQRDRIWIIANAYGQPSREVKTYTGNDNAGQMSNDVGPLCMSISNANSTGCSEQWRPFSIQEEFAAAKRCSWWEAEPALGRVVDGFPGRVDQLKALGNAIVPQIAEFIGHAIIKHESEKVKMAA